MFSPGDWCHYRPEVSPKTKALERQTPLWPSWWNQWGAQLFYVSTHCYNNWKSYTFKFPHAKKLYFKLETWSVCVTKQMCCMGPFQRGKGLSLWSRWGFIIMAGGQEDTEQEIGDHKKGVAGTGLCHVSVRGAFTHLSFGVLSCYQPSEEPPSHALYCTIVHVGWGIKDTRQCSR